MLPVTGSFLLTGIRNLGERSSSWAHGMPGTPPQLIVAAEQLRATSSSPDDEAACTPGALTSPNLLGGEEESIIMSYIPHILTFLLVLSPLYIPIGVTVVHAVRTRWQRPQVSVRTAALRRRRLDLAVEFD